MCERKNIVIYIDKIDDVDVKWRIEISTKYFKIHAKFAIMELF